MKHWGTITKSGSRIIWVIYLCCLGTEELSVVAEQAWLRKCYGIRHPPRTQLQTFYHTDNEHRWRYSWPHLVVETSALREVLCYKRASHFEQCSAKAQYFWDLMLLSTDYSITQGAQKTGAPLLTGGCACSSDTSSPGAGGRSCLGSQHQEGMGLT